jgi:diguanylate cyclase (GGDEF)-like protein/PAS domain S-box-containing protein
MTKRGEHNPDKPVRVGDAAEALATSDTDPDSPERGQESENRFRSLLQLSSDWYWEQDENYRFTGDLRGFHERPGLRPETYVGRTRWEMPCFGLTEADWEAHKALVFAHQRFDNFEYLRASSDGQFRWVSISGEPVFDVRGRFRGYRGIGKDVTERKQAQQAQAILHGVSRYLSEAESLGDAMPNIIRTFCDTMGWDYGARWEHREEDQSFACAELWCRPYLEDSAFVRMSRDRRFKPGSTGLVTRVLSQHEPHWVADVASEKGMVRGPAAHEAGLNAAFAFPILGGSKLLGALEFFAPRIWEPDLAISETARAIGPQLGQFIVRKLAEERYRELVDLSPDGILILCEGRIVFANGAACRLFGAAEQELLAGKPTLDRIHPEWRALAQRHFERQLTEHVPGPRVEMRYLRLDGAAIDVEVSSSYLVFDGKPAVQIIVRDIGERKQAEQKIFRLSNLYAALSQTNQAIMRLPDAPGLFDEVTRIAVEYGGFAMATVLMIEPDSPWIRPMAVAGKSQRYIETARISMDPELPEGRGLTGIALRSGEHIVCNDFTLEPRVILWRDALLASGMRAGANFPLRRQGVVVGVLLLCAAEVNYFDADLVELLLEMAANLSFALDAIDKDAQRRQAEERLAFLAQYDLLTGLPNRNLFRDRLSQALARAKRSGTLVALMFFDLDRFKQINDTLGHGIGDNVLQAVAARLRDHLREVDTISRLGGDEFTLIVEGVDDAAQFIPVAEKIRDSLSSPISVDGHEIFVSTSIGITVYPRDAEEADELVKNADMAMYRAKHEGRNTYLFYTQEMAARTYGQLHLERGLRRALERREFVLHYQPTVEVASGRLVGVEALIRWNGQQGMVPPGAFIPLAEETGIIVDIGAWVLREACAQAMAWRSAGLPPMQIAVNVAPRQFVQHDLLQTIRTILEETGLPAQFLEIEITENAIMQQGEGVIDTLKRLNQLGVRIAIDDFGTGYSSLAYLKRFPVQDIKVDQSFVRDIGSDPDDAAIVRAVIAMARSLGLRVIAEGVETEAQLAFLRELSCDVFQGYLLSPPLPAGELEAFLRARSPTQVISDK